MCCVPGRPPPRYPGHRKTQPKEHTADPAQQSLPSEILAAESIIGAGQAAGSGDGYFVLMLGIVGFLLFGLFNIKQIVGSINPNAVTEYLLSPEKKTRKSKSSKSDDKDDTLTLS